MSKNEENLQLLTEFVQWRTLASGNKSPEAFMRDRAKASAYETLEALGAKIYEWREALPVEFLEDVSEYIE